MPCWSSERETRAVYKEKVVEAEGIERVGTSQKQLTPVGDTA